MRFKQRMPPRNDARRIILFLTNPPTEKQPKVAEIL